MFFNKKQIKYQDNLNGTYTLINQLAVTTDEWQVIKVPEGYTCNGSSIPRFFWRLCGAPSSPKNIRAGIVHDYIYSTRRYSREECDRLFYAILRHEGKLWIIAKLMYFAVRLFGKSHY